MGCNKDKSVKKLHYVAVIVLVMLAGATVGWASLVPVNASYLVQEGIEYYIQTDKTLYDLGEDAEILYRITNLREEEVLIGCSRSGEFNLWVQKDGETVWAKAHWFQWHSPGVNLSAGEAIEMSHTWDMKNDGGNLVTPGIYNVVGVMYNEPWNYYYHRSYMPTEVTVPITIIPEPSSVALLGMGLVRLLVHEKKKKH